MMPMRCGRKVSNVEKVENLCRTATAQKIIPTRAAKSDHACAIPWRPVATPTCSRSAIAHDRDRYDAVDHIGERDAAAHMRTAAKTLCSFSNPTSPCDHQAVR
jgi:hypothetical protein